MDRLGADIAGVDGAECRQLLGEEPEAAADLQDAGVRRAAADYGQQHARVPRIRELVLAPRHVTPVPVHAVEVADELSVPEDVVVVIVRTRRRAPRVVHRLAACAERPNNTRSIVCMRAT